MKKNDSISLLVYVLMIAVVLVVGFVVIQPEINQADLNQFGGLNPIVVLLLSLIGALVVVGILTEVAHIIGAKIGGYKIRQVLILGLGWKKNKEGKTVFAAGSFDGLTGETKVTPKDPAKANLAPYIYSAYITFFLEVVACATMIVLAKSLLSSSLLYVVATTVLTVVGVILIYDAFPAALDSMNDGYRLKIISNKKNRLPYNQILLGEDCRFIGEEMPVMEPYQEVTDFTASINDIIIRSHLEKGEYEAALTVNEYALNSKADISKAVYHEAVATKLSMLLLQNKLEEGKAYFETLNTEEKKYIAAMNSMMALRSYLLVNALLDASMSETEIAIARKVSIIKRVDKADKPLENKLYKEALELIDKTHPDWEVIAQDTMPEAETSASQAQKEVKEEEIEASTKEEE